MNKYLGIIFLSITNLVTAAVSDLELSVEMENYADVFPGFEGAFSVTVTNNGPDISEFPGVGSPLMELTNTDLTFIPDTNVIQNDCFFSNVIAEPRPPDFPGGSVLLISMNPIPPGSSTTCFGRYITGFEFGNREALWRVFNFGLDNIDPVEDNDIVVINVGIQPISVNFLNTLTLILLLSIVIAFGVKALRKPISNHLS